jgi:hypothetical protein
MKAYEIEFTGRKVGAIGKFYKIRTSRFANSPEEAIRLLYEPLPQAYEHITGAVAKETRSPFCAEGLVRWVLNDRETLESFTRWAKMATSEIARVARKCAKENREWHDDPESENHPLYHAETEQQYPPEMQVEAVAEVLLYILRNTPAGLNVASGLQLTPNYTEAEQAHRGELLARKFGLKRSEDHADRWDTEDGNKTALGIYRTARRYLDEES